MEFFRIYKTVKFKSNLLKTFLQILSSVYRHALSLTDGLKYANVYIYKQQIADRILYNFILLVTNRPVGNILEPRRN